MMFDLLKHIKSLLNIFIVHACKRLKLHSYIRHQTYFNPFWKDRVIRLCLDEIRTLVPYIPAGFVK